MRVLDARHGGVWSATRTGSRHAARPSFGTKKAAQRPRRARQRPGEVLSADNAEAPPVDESAERVSVEDQDVVGYLQSWPDRREAERWVPELAKLSPAARDKLKRFLEQEIDRRRNGRRVGFAVNADTGRPTRSSQRLIDAGFVELEDGRLELTDQGRAAGRLVAGHAGGTAPHGGTRLWAVRFRRETVRVSLNASQLASLLVQGTAGDHGMPGDRPPGVRCGLDRRPS